MRVWDVHPGYLSRSRLLGQHVEIHAIWSVICGNREGYSRHPETMRWRENLPWLKHVHDLTAAEMFLRGFGHRSPLEGTWAPPRALKYIDHPLTQFSLLAAKYRADEAGRLTFPPSAKEFWRQHQANIFCRGKDIFRAMRLLVESGPLGPALLEQVILTLGMPMDHRLVFDALGIMARHVGLKVAELPLGEQARSIYAEAREQGIQSIVQASLLTDVLALAEFGGDG